jgi:ferredoxin-nitrate reductase
MGVTVRVRNSVTAMHLARNGSGISIALQSGAAGTFDAVVIAIGTRPNIDLLAAAGVECGRGVRVNDHLQTSDPRIYAMGEVAEHRGELHGITAAAEEQAEIAARHMAGETLACYEGSLRMNILKIADVHVSSIGIPSVPDGETGYEDVFVLDRSQGYYKKCIVKDDRLVGAILVGDGAELAEFRELVQTGWELRERRSTLLKDGARREPVMGKVVCSCGNVGDGNLRKAIEAGSCCLTELCAATGAGIGCGSCRPEIVRILDGMLVGAT